MKLVVFLLKTTFIEALWRKFPELLNNRVLHVCLGLDKILFGMHRTFNWKWMAAIRPKSNIIGSHDIFGEQAGAELGQAQLKLGLDFNFL